MSTRPYTWKYLVESPPTGEGPEFSREITPADVSLDPKYKDYYLTSKISSTTGIQHVVAEIVVKVKEFLLSQANRAYPGDYKAFREDEIKKIVMEVEPRIKGTNAGYCARMIQDFLIDEKIIIDETRGFRINKPINTKVIVPEIAPKLEPVLAIEPKKETPIPVSLKKKVAPQKEIKSAFKLDSRYEKGEDFDEEDLTDEEQDALGTLSDEDTGSAIVQKLQNKRAFRNKPPGEIHEIIKSLISKGALINIGGYKFTAGSEGMKSKTFGDSYKMNLNDDKLMMEAYMSKRRIVIKEGVGDWVKSQLPTFMPQAAAQAQGNIQASKQQDQIYKALLQSLGQAGYSAKNVPGSYVVKWLNDNINSNISNLPEAQKINVNAPIQNTQQAVNSIIQAVNRFNVMGQAEQPAANPLAIPTKGFGGTPVPSNVTLAQPPGATPPPTKRLVGQGGAVNTAAASQLIAAIGGAKGAAAQTRALNNWLKANGLGQVGTPQPKPAVKPKTKAAPTNVVSLPATPTTPTAPTTTTP